MIVLCKEKIKAYKDYLKDNLSKKRYVHSLNVAETAVELAKKFDGDVDKCCLAGLLHDVSKELESERQLCYVNNSELDVCDVEKNAPPLYHAIAGAEQVKELFHIDDEDIVNAIRYHTTARENMSKTEQIIYLADLVSQDREYKDVKRMRKIAFSDMEKAMYEALKFSINDSVQKGNTIPHKTLSAYNQYAKLMKQRKE
ncbi:MAG: HD domain-containing protein [Ruminococcus sp.]|nr:HD domain-containing protein [Ruminococcus sp.]